MKRELDITTYFDFELNPRQLVCFDRLVEFINGDKNKVFILKGYAGTGKTTLLRGLAKYMDEIEQPYSIHATTGRAAKVASNISGVSVSTVHSLIYTFQDLDDDLEKMDSQQNDLSVDDKGQIRLLFELKEINTNDTRIYIIDESSMISDKGEKSASYAKFGSGRLLSDLISFDKKGKFIFVGDPCQLPPISQKDSPALDSQYLKQLGMNVEEFELTQVTRQKSDNGITEISINLRRLFFQNQQIKWAKYTVQGANNISLHNSHIDLLSDYMGDVQQGNYKQTTLICQTNRHCSDLNRFIREFLYKSTNEIQNGDILMVTQNNYLCPLVNGDQVLIKKIGEIEFRCGLKFRKVVVEEFFSQKNYSILIIEDILYSPYTNLNDKQHKDLMIDFYKRMKARGIKQKDQKFKDQMLVDPYLNALRAVFGYAITCHKSQGGEWEKVYLYMDNKIHGIPKPGIYQWWYTATTRAKNELHLVNDWFIN